MAEAWATVFATLWLVPIGAALAWGLIRLAPDGSTLPEWPVSVAAVLSFAPGAGGILLVFAQLTEVTSPVPAPGAIALLLLVEAGFVALVWALTHPRAASARVGVLGGATLSILLGLFVGPSLITTGRGGLLVTLILGVPLIVLAASAAPATLRWRRSEHERLRWLAPGALGLLLVVLTFAAGGFALIEVGTGNTGAPASYRFTVALEPSGPGTYTATVPLPTGGDTARAASPVGEAFLDQLEVTAGDASIEQVSPDRLRIEAKGPVTVEARYAFWGSIGHREAFTDWRLANATATRGPGGPANVTVVWSVDFSGGQGHTCWAAGSANVTLAPDQAGPLRAGGGGEGETARPWMAACA